MKDDQPLGPGEHDRDQEELRTKTHLSLASSESQKGVDGGAKNGIRDGRRMKMGAKME